MDKLKKVMKIIIIMCILIISCQVSVFADNKTWADYYWEFVQLQNDFIDGKTIPNTKENRNLLNKIKKGPANYEDRLASNGTEVGQEMAEQAQAAAENILKSLKVVEEQDNSELDPTEGSKTVNDIIDKYNSGKYNFKDESKGGMTNEQLQELYDSIKTGLAQQGKTINDIEQGSQLENLMIDIKSASNSRGLYLDSEWSDPVPVYHVPDRTSKNRQKDDILQEVIDNAEKFTQNGNNTAIDNDDFRTIMSFIYNMFFQIGVIAAVIIAAVLGIKFMLSSLEQKAEVKKMLGVYVIACVVIFGSFGIWKLVLTILDQM